MKGIAHYAMRFIRNRWGRCPTRLFICRTIFMVLRHTNLVSRKSSRISIRRQGQSPKSREQPQGFPLLLLHENTPPPKANAPSDTQGRPPVLLLQAVRIPQAAHGKQKHCLRGILALRQVENLIIAAKVNLGIADALAENMPVP